MTTPEKRIRPQPKSGIIDGAPQAFTHKPTPEGVETHQLSLTRNPFGASPAVVEVTQRIEHGLEPLAERGCRRLRVAIGAMHGVSPDSIVCTNGADEAITLLTNAYLATDDEGIVTENSFIRHRACISATGATPVIVGEVEETASVDLMLDAVNERTRMVLLSNPNNPTGTYLSFSELKRLQEGLPENVLLVLDAAYAEYVRRADYEPGVRLVSESENVVMLRTFSKAYGVGATRLGWVYCPDHVAGVLNRLRPPFSVPSAAIEVGLAAINDHEHLVRTIEHNEHWLPWLTEELTQLGLRVTPSVGNFVLVHFPADGRHTAVAADKFLWSQGILVRWVIDYGLRDALRMTVGRPEANRKLVEALRKFLAS